MKRLYLTRDGFIDSPSPNVWIWDAKPVLSRVLSHHEWVAASDECACLCLDREAVEFLFGKLAVPTSVDDMREIDP